MPGPGEVTMGRAHVDPSGKKPTRIGLNTGGLDMQDTGTKIKEATLASAQKQTEIIDKNKSKVLPAISALQAKVQALQADAIALSNRLDDATGIENSFRNLQASVTRFGKPATSYVDVTIDQSAAQATNNGISIRVLQIASVDSRITTNTVKKLDDIAITSSTEALGLSGSFQINGGELITIAPSDSLYSITSAINNSNSDIQASFKQNGNQFYLILNGSELAKPITFVDDAAILSTYFGISTDPTDIGKLKAKVECDIVDGAHGVVTKEYTFDTNIVEDLMPGVTIKLLNPSKNSSGTYDDININISNNTGEACEKIVAFFVHFNEIREILNRNLMEDEDHNPLDPEALMFRIPLIRALDKQLSAIANFMFVGGNNESKLGAKDGDYKSCKDIGIVRDAAATGFQTGTFTITDKQKILSAITNNFEKVRKLFGNYATTTNTNFHVADLGTNLDRSIAGKPIKITLSTKDGKSYARFQCAGHDSGDIEQTTISRLVGPKGSIFEKITIDYKGAPVPEESPVTFSMTATQGLALTAARSCAQSLQKETRDKKTGELTPSGDFETAVKTITKKNEKLEKRVKEIEKKADREEKKWIAQAARYDAMKSRYADFSRQLDSMMTAMSNNRH